MELLVATTNKGKVLELQDLLTSLPVRLVDLSEFSIPEPDESGSTFAENSRIKAVQYAVASGHMSIADDSGLEVKYLGGRPGVHSARYAGPDPTDEMNNEKLLRTLEGVEMKNRTARFVCAITIASSAGEVVFSCEGYCTGRIDIKASGDGGFGYDPLFIPDGFTESFGLLPNKVKRRISHRAVALGKTLDFLTDFSGVSA